MHTQYVYRDIVGLTNVLKVFLALGMALAVVGMLSSFMQLELLDREHFTEAEGEANDLRERIIGLVDVAFRLLTVVIFGRWIFRANKNARALGADDLPTTPGWAVGYFFVPILSLWRPYQAMRDLWQASHNPASWHTTAAGSILPVWWTLWILSNIIGQIAFRLSLHATDVAGFRTATVAQIVGLIIDIPLGLVAIVLISQIASAQTRHGDDIPYSDHMAGGERS